MMKNIVNAVKKFLFVGLAGILLFVSTACNQPPNTASQSSTEGYSKTAQGMNRFSDTEQGQRNQYTENKAKDLVKGAQRNLQNRNASPQEAIDTAVNDRPVQEGAKRVSDTAKEITSRPVRDIKEIGERNSQNLKENVNAAKKSIGNAVENAKENVQDAVQ